MGRRKKKVRIVSRNWCWGERKRRRTKVSRNWCWKGRRRKSKKEQGLEGGKQRRILVLEDTEEGKVRRNKGWKEESKEEYWCWKIQKKEKK